MYSSSRKRCPKTTWALKLLTAAFLAASPAAKSAVNNAYDALIIEARKGNTQPALSWFALKSALSNNQIADWLQIALWAGQDKQVIKSVSAVALPFIRTFEKSEIMHRNLLS